MRTIRHSIVLAVASLLAAFGFQTRAGDLDIAWTHPTQYTDNTPIAAGALTSTELEYGICNAAKTGFAGTPVLVSAPFPAAQRTVTGLGAGTWCVRARSKTADATSDWTGFAWKQIILTPKPPTLLTVAQVVYETKIHPTQGLAAGRAVGSVALGVTCYANPAGQPFASSDLYRVRLSDVRLSKAPRSELLVARCGAGA